MTVRLIGRSPKSSAGRRLVLSSDSFDIVALLVASHSVEIAHRLNDRRELDEKEATDIGVRILADFDSGASSFFEITFRAFVSGLELEDCPLCDATGIRTDSVGRAFGLDERELDEATAILLGRDRGTCDGCHGEGRRVHRLATARLDLRTMRRFGRFLVECGGLVCE